MALVLLGAPLAIGGVHVVSRAALAGFAVLGWLWAASKDPRGSASTSHLLWKALVGLTALTLLQLLPLPLLWVGSFFEGRVEILHGVDAALGLDPRQSSSWALDKGRTSAAVLDLLGWTALIATLGYLRRDLSVSRVMSCLVMMAGLGVLSAGVLHLITDSDQILGFYRPDADLSQELFMTTFVNPNHAGALLLMSSLVAFGLWIDSQKTQHARSLLLLSALLGLGVLATGSTANSMLLATGLPLIGLWTSRRSEAAERGRILRALFGAFMLAGIAIMMTDPQGWWDTVVSPHLPSDAVTPWKRVSEVWQIGASISQEHAGFGVGFGSFPIAAAATMESWTSGFVNFAHNMLLEGAASWGIFIMAVMSALVFMALIRGARRAQTGVQVAIVVALCATAIQNGVDFSLLIPGVGYCWAALLSTILVPYEVDRERATARTSAGGRLAPAILIGLITVAVGSQAIALDRRSALHTAQEELRSGGATSETRDRLALNHSMDFIAIGYASDLSSALGETDRSRTLADLSVELAPHYPLGLLRRARIAIETEPDDVAQAWLERLASCDYTAFKQAMSLVAEHAQERPEFVMSFVAKSPRYVVGTSHALNQQGRTKAGYKLLQWGRKHFPQSEEIATHLIRRLLREPNNDKTLALIDASAIQYLANSTSVEDPLKSARLKRLGYLAMAHVHSRDKRLEEAWHLFEAAARLDLERDVDARLGQAQILLRQGRYDALERVLSNLNEERVEVEQAQWRVHEFWSQLAEARGELRAAIRSQQRALLFRPKHPRLLRRLERLTEKRTRRTGDDRDGAP